MVLQSSNKNQYLLFPLEEENLSSSKILNTIISDKKFKFLILFIFTDLKIKQASSYSSLYIRYSTYSSLKSGFNFIYLLIILFDVLAKFIFKAHSLKYYQIFSCYVTGSAIKALSNTKIKHINLNIFINLIFYFIFYLIFLFTFSSLCNFFLLLQKLSIHNPNSWHFMHK